MLFSKSVCHDNVVKCHNIYAAPMSSTFVASLLRQCGLTFFFDDCHDKLFIVMTNFLCLLLCFCHDIFAAPMSLTFVASLSRQCGLIFLFDDPHDKLFIFVTNFLCILLCFCRNKALKCRDKVQLTLFHNCHDKIFYVVTFFLNSSLCLVATMICMS